MDWFRNSTTLQKIIYLIIAGITALVGLVGLQPEYSLESSTYEYHTAAALSTAFFVGALLLVLFSPLLYLARKREQKK